VSLARLLGVAVALVGLTACTGTNATESTTPPPPAATTTTSTTLPAADSTVAYTDCLREHGVEIDSIRLDANGRPRLDLVNSQLDYSDPVTIEALSVCAGLLSDGALDLGYDSDFRESVMEQLTAFSRCVRARGVGDFPDPIAGFIGIGSPFPAAEIPYSDPGLGAAVAACQQSIFGEFPGSGG